MIDSLIALPYEIARLPWAVVDSGLSKVLPETSLPRVTLDRTLGSADKLAGTLLANRDIARRGAERIERSAQLLSALRLEEESASRRQEARRVAAAGRREAAEKREAAQARAASGLDEADAAEVRGKRKASVDAARAASAKQVAADQRAAHRASTVEQRKRRTGSAAEARKRTARRKANGRLDDARRSQRSAAEARADAERLGDVTEAKKQQRRRG